MASNVFNDTATVENGSGLSTVEEIPKKIVDLNTTEPDDVLDGEFKESTVVSGEKKDESDTIGSTAAAGDDVSPPVDDDVQKKIRRAERFGVSVKLTEEEKRNSRAERFGTVAAAAAVKGSEGTKKAEDLKRKARADRFGVPASSSSTTTKVVDKTEEEAKKKAKVDKTEEEEAKKKARLARFGKDTPKVDSAEDDKRKARALRFSKPASDASSDLPGKEAVVSGNAA